MRRSTLPGRKALQISKTLESLSKSEDPDMSESQGRGFESRGKKPHLGKNDVVVLQPSSLSDLLFIPLISTLMIAF